jgi:hypothetical protein
VGVQHERAVIEVFDKRWTVVLDEADVVVGGAQPFDVFLVGFAISPCSIISTATTTLLLQSTSITC